MLSSNACHECPIKYPTTNLSPANVVDTLKTYHDFSAKSRPQIRSTNPINSTFATARLQAVTIRECVSRASTLATVLKLRTALEQ